MSGLILLKDVTDLENDYEVESVDLTQDYWTPTKDGEQKRVVFWEISSRKCRDDDGNQIELDCAIFIVPGSEDESHKTIANGSKRLVAVFENNDIPKGTPVQITFKGKKKNATNQNSSDHWSVVTLVKKGAK